MTVSRAISRPCLLNLHARSEKGTTRITEFTDRYCMRATVQLYSTGILPFAHSASEMCSEIWGGSKLRGNFRDIWVAWRLAGGPPKVAESFAFLRTRDGSSEYPLSASPPSHMRSLCLENTTRAGTTGTSFESPKAVQHVCNTRAIEGGLHYSQCDSLYTPQQVYDRIACSQAGFAWTLYRVHL